MLKENLEIQVITYNRAKALDRTLAQLRDSPFSGCKITVLDNCSTDQTPEVCSTHQAEFSNLHVLRHQKNMGLSANYLRAVEISTSLYTWILCDDDQYDFGDCSDVVAAIEEGKFDLICVGAPGQKAWEHGLKTTTKGLWRRGARYFYVHTFFPSIIFKTDRFDSECLTMGYHNAANAYPNQRFVIKALEQDFSEYVSKRLLVSRDGQDSVHLGLHWLTIAFNSCGTIPNPRMRRLALYEARETRIGWLKLIAEQIMVGKLSAPEKVPRQFLFLFLPCVGEQRLRLLTLLPLVLMPSAAYKLIRLARRTLLGRKHGDTDFTAGGSKATGGDASVDVFRG